MDTLEVEEIARKEVQRAVQEVIRTRFCNWCGHETIHIRVTPNEGYPWRCLQCFSLTYY